MNAELGKMGYRDTKIRNFDILSNKSKWQTICGLTGSDRWSIYAVSICGKVLFDGNVSDAMVLTKENLNCGAMRMLLQHRRNNEDLQVLNFLLA